MRDLSVLIPANTELWLLRTVEDVLRNLRADTEIIVVADGALPLEPIPQHPRVNLVCLPTSIGQRAAVNLAAHLSTARYVMKLDAHCAVDEGFDVKLIEAAAELGPDVTQIPAQHNLHVFDWVCDSCGERTYQGAQPPSCKKCKKTALHRDVVWIAKRRRSEFWRFDTDLKFGYWNDYKNRPAAKGDIVDVMTSLGACFFMERARFWELGGLDADHGSWGQFGVEIALKSMLSGGRHVVNKRTWFSHLFRTQAGFSFPYRITGKDQDYARTYSRNLWLGNHWPQQVRPLAYVIEKFAPIPYWHDAAGAEALARVLAAKKAFRPPAPSVPAIPAQVQVLPAAAASTPATSSTAGVVYYSDCRPDPSILGASRRTIEASGMPIVAVTLAPVRWAAARNIVLDMERGPLAMFSQILAGLEALDTDVVFLAEHDVLYHPSHFQFRPLRRDTFYYNQHVYKVDAGSGRALHYLCNQTSGLCADRGLLLAHYRARVAHVAEHGFTQRNGFEPGTRKTRHGGFDDTPVGTWMSEHPNVDVRHALNLTPSRWKKSQFRNQKYTAGWTEADSVPGWGVTAGRFGAWLESQEGARGPR